MRWTLDLELANSSPAQLAEGPVWDGWDQTLWWVDIDRHQLWRKRFGEQPVVHDVGQEVAAVLPRRSGGMALVVRSAIVLTDEQLTVTKMIPVPLPFSQAMRLNDAACDPAGRLWFGSMATDGQSDRGSLYTLAHDHALTRAFGPVSISNGLGWSPDGRTMYYVDTPTGRVDAFPFDQLSGRLGRRRTLASIPAGDGKPDGLTVAADGSLWVALWGGSAVQRFTSSGRPVGRVKLPTRNVTSCCFGGTDLDELYITTARRGLTAAEQEAEPTAGRMFVCRPGARGMPVHRYIG